MIYLFLAKFYGSSKSNKLNGFGRWESRLGFKEIVEVSKPRIIVLLVITAVTSMYAASKLIGPELDTFGLLHIVVAGSLASAGSSALNHSYDRDIDPKMKRTSPMG